MEYPLVQNLSGLCVWSYSQGTFTLFFPKRQNDMYLKYWSSPVPCTGLGEKYNAQAFIEKIPCQNEGKSWEIGIHANRIPILLVEFVLPIIIKVRVPKKKFKVWSLTKPADPPPMLKCGLLIANFFKFFFWLLISFKPYKSYYGHKKVLKNFKIIEKNTKEYQ